MKRIIVQFAASPIETIDLEKVEQCFKDVVNNFTAIADILTEDFSTEPSENALVQSLVVAVANTYLENPVNSVSGCYCKSCGRILHIVLDSCIEIPCDEHDALFLHVILN